MADDEKTRAVQPGVLRDLADRIEGGNAPSLPDDLWAALVRFRGQAIDHLTAEALKRQLGARKSKPPPPER